MHSQDCTAVSAVSAVSPVLPFGLHGPPALLSLSEHGRFPDGYPGTFYILARDRDEERVWGTIGHAFLCFHGYLPLVSSPERHCSRGWPFTNKSVPTGSSLSP